MLHINNTSFESLHILLLYFWQHFPLSLSLNIILYREHLNQRFLSGYLFSINATKPSSLFTYFFNSSGQFAHRSWCIECLLTFEFYLQLWVNEKFILKYHCIFSISMKIKYLQKQYDELFSPFVQSFNVAFFSFALFHSNRKSSK